MTHFEYMESIGQTNIFEFLEPSTIDIGDEVIITLPDPVAYSDIYYYLLYYHPHIINKRGLVIDRQNSSYLVSVEGGQVWLSEVEIEKTTP